MEFQYNFFSSKSKEEQWELYLQSKAGMFNELQKSVASSSEKQTKDISLIVKQQTSEMNDTLQRSTKEQVDAIQKSTESVCGTMENGFNLLSSDLKSLTYGIDDLKCEISDMASMLDWNLSLLIEHQKVTNLLLGNISILLRIPDIQKERQFYVEQGMKFLKNAIFDNDFYDDSLTNLLKAEQIEPTDYFALHRIGLIYMYSPKHLDLSKAERYFSRAAKYAVGETNFGATVTTNFLAGDLNGNLVDQIESKDKIKLQAAESYLFAARSCYIQGKLDESAEFASKGFNLVPQMLELGFMQAKALAANNNEKQSAIFLERVINTDRYYSLKTLNDPDLCTKHEIQLLLNKLKREATEEAQTLLNKWKQIQIPNSQAAHLLGSIEQLIIQNTYLTSKKAIDLIQKVWYWDYSQPLQNPNQVKYFNELFEMANTVYSLSFYKSGGVFKEISQDFKNSFSELLRNETQWDFRITNNIKDIKSHSVKANVIDFLKKERQFDERLPIVVTEFKTKVIGYIEENNQRLTEIKNERTKAENERVRAENERIKAENQLKSKQKRTKIWEGIFDTVGNVILFAISLVGASIIFLVFCLLGSIFYDHDLTDFNSLKRILIGVILFVVAEIIAWFVVKDRADAWF